MSDRLDHVNSTSSVTKCRERRTPLAGPADWTSVFREMGDQLDRERAQSGSVGPLASPEGPAELALTVVAEALAVAVALGAALGAADNSEQPSEKSQKAGLRANSAAIYAGIDSRHLDHRARALRSALHSVDDYIWWGGLGAGG